jgi:hypothetical protein
MRCQVFLEYNYGIMGKKTVMAAVAALFAAVVLTAQPNKNAAQKETAAPQKNPPIILATPDHQDDGNANTAKSNTDPPASHTPLKDPSDEPTIVYHRKHNIHSALHEAGCL